VTATGGAAMTPALPAVEHVWVIEATYAADAAERRPQFRAEHLARIVELKAAGTLIEAGAFDDLSASLVMVRGDSEQAVLEVCRADVYCVNGVWTGLRARPFGRVA